jgi:hypothetical protein
VTALSDRKRDLLAVLALLTTGTLFFADVLAGGVLYLRDLTRYYYPTKRIIREIILSGEFPYWNPYYSAGQPMAANPEYEIFYPPQWLILLPSYDLGYRLHIVVHVYVALLGMFFLLRSMDLTRRASVYGAVLYGVGGFYLSTVNLLPIMFAFAWVPLIVLFARRFLLRPNVRDFALAALFIGMQCLVGEPTSLVQTWFLLFVYALYRGWHDGPRRVRAMAVNLVLLGLVIAGGSLIGAAQIFPAIDHVGDSVRSRPFEYSLVTSWSMPWAKPLELIFPNVFGHMSIDHVTWYWGSGMYPKTGSGFLYNTYQGLLLIALVLAAFAVRPRGGRATLFIALFSALVALGGHTPLFRILYDAGIGRSIRYPEKFMAMGLFALILLAATLFDRLVRRDRRVIDTALGVLAGTLVFALAIAVLSHTDLFGQLFSRLWGYKGAALERMVAISRVDWWLAVARGAVFAALLWWIREKRASLAWYALMMLAVTADLWWVGREMKPTFPRHFLTPPPVGASLERSKADYRIFHEPDWYGSSQIAKKYFGTGSAVYWIVRNGLYPMTPATWGFRTVLERDYDKTALLPTVDFTDAMWRLQRREVKHWPETVMSMSNGWYRAVYVPFEEEAKRVKGAMQNARPIRFEKVAENPRYYFATLVVQSNGVDDFVEKLLQKQWPAGTAFADLPSREPAAGTVRIVRERANSVVLDLQSAGAGLLVAANTTHKYWRATIDGRPAPIRTVNVTYQGVEVPAGNHRVVFRYRNTVVAVSVWISLLSAAAALIAAAFGSAVGPPVAKPHPERVEEHPGGVADHAHP